MMFLLTLSDPGGGVPGGTFGYFDDPWGSHRNSSVGMVVAALLGHTISSCKPPILLHDEATVQFIVLPIVYWDVNFVKS